MRVLVFGGSGQVGEEIRALPPLNDVHIVAPERSDVDLTDATAIARIIAADTWCAVINAAAYTDVDRAESEQSIAFAVNAEAATQIAVETRRRGIPLAHISTDYVFDGLKGAPYVETDDVAPLNVYGRSKLAGEQGVRDANPQHVILRTSWVYSPYRNNFVKTILRLAKERERLSIVDDQFGCPTAANDVAIACRDIAVRCGTNPDHVPYGTYHFAGAGEASWFEFGQSIMAFASDRLITAPMLAPIKTTEYPTPAIRPRDTRLDCSALNRKFGIRARPWRKALEDTIRRLWTPRSTP